ncbi:MAG: pilus assembly protein CpaC [Alphaproteobacteria bacterium]|nr:MAG: pilus assembly protein CpaC [Alphaproteobacteria bacterium]
MKGQVKDTLCTFVYHTAFVYLVALVFTSLMVNSLSAQTMVVTAKDFDKHAGELVVIVDKSQILNLDVPYKDVLVGNPEVADILPLTNKSIYIIGKKTGSTSLTVYGPKKRLIAVLDLVVSLDLEGLKSRLYELMPGEKFEVRPANGAILLSGAVSSAGHLSKALAVAERYAPGLVTNLMSVTGSQQVLLEVRFAEVQRSTIKQLGFNLTAIGSDFLLGSGDIVINGSIDTGNFGIGDINFGIGDTDFNILFDNLEQRGLVKTLAEPNLVAMSGDTASFLAGGEFPVPVARAGGSDGQVTITVEFKQFGIALAFTPTVLDNGLINLVVSPEVSNIDRNSSVTISGFNIPGLATRRAKTTVELRDGQSFAIAGLIKSDFQDTIRQFPILGDMPIIGALFRNSRYEKNETELVIVVTPHLVQPAMAGQIRTPADGFIPPNDFEFFLMGKLENDQSNGGPAMNPRAMMKAREAGGIEGDYGHIIE